MVEKSKNWWETLGGLLTGIAALITACTGLMVALDALNRPESGSGNSMATTPRIATSNSSETRTRTEETKRPSDAPASSGQVQSTFVISLPEKSEYVIGPDGQAARYELQSGDISPATAEADVLRIRVLFANLSENPNSRMNFESRSFQLVINGRKLSPKENFNYMVLSKRVREEDVLFQIPKGLKQATLKMGTHVDGVRRNTPNLVAVTNGQLNLPQYSCAVHANALPGCRDGAVRSLTRSSRCTRIS